MNAGDRFSSGLGFGRWGGAFLVYLAGILLFCVEVPAATTNELTDAEKEGRSLAQQLLAQGPATNFVQTGELNIRISRGKYREIPFRLQTQLIEGGWREIYEASGPSNQVRLAVTHEPGRPIGYQLQENPGASDGAANGAAKTLAGSQIMTPFADSDFWVADLGREFFQWPEQRLLKREFKRGCGCRVLESIDPQPSPNGYSRVVSWIDNETGGIVQAEGYDARGKLLKEFAPKSFKKMNGQWELQEMEIRNVQSGSRTRLDFDLKTD